MARQSNWATMADVAVNESPPRASIVGEVVTAAGIVALGTLLFTVLRHHGEDFARIAMGLYLVEAGLLAVREVVVFALWWTSEEAAGPRSNRRAGRTNLPLELGPVCGCSCAVRPSEADVAPPGVPS